MIKRPKLTLGTWTLNVVMHVYSLNVYVTVALYSIIEVFCRNTFEVQDTR